MLDSADIRKINLNRIRKELWKGGDHTKLSMASDTGLSVATCNTLLNELLENGEVIGEKRQLNSVGRSSMAFRLNEEFESILCIRFDLQSNNARSLNVDVLSMLGNIKYSYAITSATISPEIIGSHLTSCLSKFPNISFILIGVNGIIDNGVIKMSDIPEMENINLSERMLSYTRNIPFYMAYDGQFRAYGAYWINNLKHLSLTSMHCIRNVIPGTSTVVDGKIIKGKNGFAGMIGYMPSGYNPKDINDQIATGNFDIIARFIASVITVINPDRFIFTGNVIQVEDLGKICAECARYVPADFLPEFSVAADGGEQYYLKGMYYMAIDNKTGVL